MIRAKAMFSTKWYIGSELKILTDKDGLTVYRLICRPEGAPQYEIIIDPKTIEYFGD